MVMQPTVLAHASFPAKQYMWHLSHGAWRHIRILNKCLLIKLQQSTLFHNKSWWQHVCEGLRLIRKVFSCHKGGKDGH